MPDTFALPAGFELEAPTPSASALPAGFELESSTPALASAKPGPYLTKLQPADEQSFQTWVKANKVPFDPSPTADYDMRGYWKDNQGKLVGTEISKFDGELHFP